MSMLFESMSQMGQLWVISVVNFTLFSLELCFYFLGTC